MAERIVDARCVCRVGQAFDVLAEPPNLLAMLVENDGGQIEERMPARQMSVAFDVAAT
ncbi:hypothetical protein BH23PSE1_BH23PSE1_06300 [soil metagenome]